MKRKLTKAEFEALTPEMKLLYVAEGADAYILPLTDYTDPGPIERARDRERDAAAQLRTELATANTELTTLRASTPKDVVTLTRQHNEALATAKAAEDVRIATYKAQVESALLPTTAKSIADAITATPANANVMLPHINARLAVEWNGDVATVKIKNADGTLGSAFTPETGKALQKEFVDNAQFGAIVVKSKASGGGAAGQAGSGGSGGAGGGKKFSEMTGPEKTELFNSNRAEFDSLAAADKTEKAARRFGPPKLLIQQ